FTGGSLKMCRLRYGTVPANGQTPLSLKVAGRPGFHEPATRGRSATSTGVDTSSLLPHFPPVPRPGLARMSRFRLPHPALLLLAGVALAAALTWVLPAGEF